MTPEPEDEYTADWDWYELLEREILEAMKTETDPDESP